MDQKKTLRHSKFKNTGILFELLVQQVTSDILSGKQTTKAKDILHKYFHETTNIGKELKLYQYLINEKIRTVNQADRLMETVLDSRKKISTNALSKEKYDLIKEIRDNYDIDAFLKGNISNYKVLASVYKIFENSVSKDIEFEAREVFQAKSCLIEHIVNKNTIEKKVLDGSNDIFESYKKQSYDEKILTYKILVDSFNKKYSVLCDDQKNLLREFVNGSTTVKEYIEKNVPIIVKTLQSYHTKIDSNVVKIKLNEVISQLQSMRIGLSVKDNHLTTMLLSYELIKELKEICK